MIVLSSGDFLSEIKELAITVKLHTFDDFCAIISDQVRVFSDDKIDLFIVEHEGKLRIRLIRGDDKVELAKAKIIQKHILEVAVDVLGVHLILGVIFNIDVVRH